MGSSSGFFEERRLRKALHRYLVELRSELGSLFGDRDCYALDEVDEAAIQAELPLDYLRYGYALFSSEQDFTKEYEPANDRESYSELRTAIGRLFFDGNNWFTSEDVRRYAKSHPTGKGNYVESEFGPDGSWGPYFPPQ
jgi:hypothetical protein